MQIRIVYIKIGDKKEYIETLDISVVILTNLQNIDGKQKYKK